MLKHRFKREFYTGLVLESGFQVSFNIRQNKRECQ